MDIFSYFRDAPSPIADNILPPFFPRAPKQCESSSQSFFSCLSVNSTKLGNLSLIFTYIAILAYVNFVDNDDAEAGVRGLKSCLKEKKNYERCMLAYEKTNEVKLYRVQKEYRKYGNK